MVILSSSTRESLYETWLGICFSCLWHSNNIVDSASKKVFIEISWKFFCSTFGNSWYILNNMASQAKSNLKKWAIKNSFHQPKPTTWILSFSNLICKYYFYVCFLTRIFFKAIGFSDKKFTIEQLTILMINCLFVVAIPGNYGTDIIWVPPGVFKQHYQLQNFSKSYPAINSSGPWS